MWQQTKLRLVLWLVPKGIIIIGKSLSIMEMSIPFETLGYGSGLNSNWDDYEMKVVGSSITFNTVKHYKSGRI